MTAKALQRQQLVISTHSAMVNPSHPSDDLKDTARGARLTPYSVTYARRAGQPVNFNQSCSNPCCWFWEFFDASDVQTVPVQTKFHNYIKPGQRIYHFERHAFEQLRDEHGGKCPECGNTHITGQTAEGVELA